MSRLSSGQRVGVFALLALVASIVGLNMWRAWQAASASNGITLHDAPSQPAVARPATVPPVPPSDNAMQASVATAPAPSAPASPELVVHVVGAVRHPGVYHLPAGARNDDALRAAGGPTDGANTVAVNLAARLEDGTQLYIPTRREHPEDHAPTTASPLPSSASQAASASTNATSSGRKSAGHARSGSSRSGRSEKLTTPGQVQIDLNTASAEELQRIPGIGPAMAGRLIAYRQQNGAFHAVEDLLQVSGIGEKKLAKIQPYVKVR